MGGERGGKCHARRTPAWVRVRAGKGVCHPHSSSILAPARGTTLAGDHAPRVVEQGQGPPLCGRRPGWQRQDPGLPLTAGPGVCGCAQLSQGLGRGERGLGLCVGWARKCTPGPPMQHEGVGGTHGPSAPWTRMLGSPPTSALMSVSPAVGLLAGHPLCGRLAGQPCRFRLDVSLTCCWFTRRPSALRTPRWAAPPRSPAAHVPSSWPPPPSLCSRCVEGAAREVLCCTLTARGSQTPPPACAKKEKKRRRKEQAGSESTTYMG